MTEQPYVARFMPGPWVVHSARPTIVVPMQDAEKKRGGSVDEARDAEYAREIATADDDDFAKTGWPHRFTLAQAKANARLIAAAPQLYDALLYVFDHIADKERTLRDLYPAFGLNAGRALEMCREALAKAVPHTVAERHNDTSNTDTSPNTSTVDTDASGEDGA